MPNTRDTIEGNSDREKDQKIFERLIMDELEEFTDDTITGDLRTDSFSHCKSLTSVTLPEVTQVGFPACENLITANIPKVTNCTFSNCKNLQNIKLPNISSLPSNGFSNTYNLNIVELGNYSSTSNISFGSNLFNNSSVQHLILHNNFVLSKPQISGSATWSYPLTNMQMGLGYYYVPASLLSDYKQATNWSAVADQILPITYINDELVLQQDFSTIKDNWSQILAAENITDIDNENYYKNKYKLGDTKIIQINGKDIIMEIVAFDTDILETGGTAKITWISKNILGTQNFTVSTTSYGWINSGVYDYYETTLKTQLPDELRATGILKSVQKTYKIDRNNQNTILSSIWLPSIREMFCEHSSSGWCETDGVFYYDSSTTNNIHRCKYQQDAQTHVWNPSQWYLRSCLYRQSGYRMNAAGTLSSTSGNTTIAVPLVFGFCT